MRALITGGAGFIGSHIIDKLIARGDQVVVLDNFSTGNLKNLKHLLNNPNLKIEEGSILDVSLLEKLISSVDSIYHLAAAVGVFTIVDQPLQSLLTNVRGTENVLEAAHKFRKEVLIASSSEIYGKNEAHALHEESDRIVGSPLKSRWSYSEAKAIDESMAYFYFNEKGLPVRLVRFFNTVGPRQVGHYGMVVPRFVSAAISDEALVIYGTGKQSRCFCHVLDAVEAVLAITDSVDTIGEVYNVGNDFEISIENLAKLVIEQTNSKSKIEKILYDDAYPNGFEDMQRRVPDISKIKRDLAWAPKLSLNSVIKDISEHLRK